MTGNPIHDQLLAIAPDESTFLSFPDGPTLTYGALRDRVGRTAAALAAAGVAPGDRVLCQIAKSPDGLILYLATVCAGAIFVPINTAYTPSEVDYFLEDAAPALIVLDDSTAVGRSVAEARGVPVLTPGEITARAASAQAAAAVPRGKDDLAAILYTSGTTGRSKGAMLTQENLVSNALVLTNLWRFTAVDRLLHALPIFHTHGLFVATNVALCAGAEMIFLPAFNLDLVAGVLPRATAMMGVPTFYTRMLGDARFDRQAMAHMRLIVSGSAPLLAEAHRAFARQTGHAILERYGMTETNMITSNPYDDDRRAGTVGHPLPGVDLRIARPDAAGIGGIEVRGPNVTPGYWRNAEKTGESFTDDGWFITGDLGQRDGDGYVTIVGREKDLVISGGFNIYPKEVEALIDALPGVVESAVFGLPDPDLGEVVAAAIVLEQGARMTEAALQDALGADLARFKIPRRVRFLAELPRNAMGKVQKAALRRDAGA